VLAALEACFGSKKPFQPKDVSRIRSSEDSALSSPVRGPDSDGQRTLICTN